MQEGIKMPNIEIHLVVYEAGGKYYSSRYFDKKAWDLVKGRARVIFTITGTDPDKLEEEATREARKRNLPAVVNLF
jgi:hypothetical protein